MTEKPAIVGHSKMPPAEKMLADGTFCMPDRYVTLGFSRELDFRIFDQRLPHLVAHFWYRGKEYVMFSGYPGDRSPAIMAAWALVNPDATMRILVETFLAVDEKDREEMVVKPEETGSDFREEREPPKPNAPYTWTRN